MKKEQKKEEVEKSNESNLKLSKKRLFIIFFLMTLIFYPLYHCTLYTGITSGERCYFYLLGIFFAKYFIETAFFGLALVGVYTIVTDPLFIIKIIAFPFIMRWSYNKISAYVFKKREIKNKKLYSIAILFLVWIFFMLILLFMNILYTKVFPSMTFVD